MSSKGWIPFELAVAMVLGENLGTTITANIAAISGNVQAKRAAFSHFIFNIFGVIWMLAVISPFTKMVRGLAEGMTGLSPEGLQGFVNSHPELVSSTSEDTALASEYLAYQTSVSYGLSLFHTIYNIINVTVMIWFVNVYVKIVSTVIKNKKTGEEEEFQLKYISAGILSTSELSLLQAKKEIELYGIRTTRMYGMARDLMNEKPDSEAFNKLFSRIQKYEQISDNMEVEIGRYLNNVSDGRLSFDGKMTVNAMMTETTEIESIGDSCYSIARAIQRKNNENIVFNEYILEHISNMFRLVGNALENMNTILSKTDINDIDINKTYNIEMELNNYRNMLRNANMENINNKKYEYKAGIHFMDIISECEKLGDYVVNVIDAVREKRSIKK